jgi:hypothetical protein
MNNTHSSAQLFVSFHVLINFELAVKPARSTTNSVSTPFLSTPDASSTQYRRLGSNNSQDYGASSSFLPDTPALVRSLLFKLGFLSTHRLRSTRSSSDSEAPPSAAAPIVAKITSKILAYIQLLDSSMLAGQIAFHLASEGLVFSMSHQEQNEWEVDYEGTIERMQAKAEQGLEEARKVERVMRDVRQEFYKVSSVFHLTVVDD